ncbi:MAG: hypothetical protein HYS88_01485 [Candidatus Colwellbacteria bacterium]|nr:hypothetical protein [Candidatus Colwellbacteria bacterium]
MIKRLFTERLKMLAAVEPCISIELRERLREKLAMEKERLSNLISPDTKKADTNDPEKSAPELNRAFFERRPLTTGFFE